MRHGALLGSFRSAHLLTKLLISFSLVGALAGGTVAYAASTGNGKADIGMQLAPISQTLTRGASVTYTVTVSSVNGFTGLVALTASGLPSGASATFAPGAVTIASSTQLVSSTLTVAASTTAQLGTQGFTVTGTSGKITGSLIAGLTINPPVTSSIVMSVAPSAVTLGPGAIAVYTATITRTGYAGPIAFSTAGLPSGSSSSFSDSPTSGNNSLVQVTTSDTMKDGTYTFTLTASGTNGLVATATLQFTVRTSDKAFTISGSATGLAPGLSLPLDLQLTNGNKKQIAISNLTVTIAAVHQNGTGTPACTMNDYAIVQYSGPYPLTLAGLASNVSLRSLAGSDAVLPRVAMKDTASNQDACKGATLTLSYSGSGQGS